MASPSGPPCPACLATAAGRGFSKSGFTYRSCGACGLAWLDPLPSAAQAAALYGSEYFTAGANAGYADYLADVPLHLRNARRRLDLMARAGATPPGRLLDVGCAAGCFLEEARARGFTVHGVDVSAWAVDEARRRLGDVVLRSLSEVPRELAGTFGAVTMFQALEHTPGALEMLAQARTLLRPDGWLFIETWDRRSLIARAMGRNWQQVSPPSVVWLFTRKSLQAMLERAGFALLSWRRTSKEVSLGFVAQLLVRKHPSLRRPLSLFTGSGRLARLAVPYRLGDLVTVVARRK